MWTAIVNWFSSKGGITHVLAAVYVFLIGAYATVPAFAALVKSIEGALPGWADQLVLATLGLLALYMNPVSAKLRRNQGAGNVVKIGIVVALLSLCTLSARAQTGIPVAVSASASDIHYQGTSYAASHTVEGIDLLNLGASKNTIVSVAAHQILASGLNIYGVGAGIQPDISGLLKKTNIPVDSLAFAVDGFGGYANLPTGSSGAGAWEIRGSLSYALTPNVALSTAYAGGGMIGSHGFYEISAGLTLFPNPAANASHLVQLMVRRHNAARAAAKLVQ